MKTKLTIAVLISALSLTMCVNRGLEAPPAPHQRVIDDGELFARAQTLFGRSRGVVYDTKSNSNVAPREQKIAYTPKWGHSTFGQSDKWQIVETELDFTADISIMDQETFRVFEAKNDSAYIQNRTHLVYRRDKDTGTEESFLMTIVPDFEYIEAKGFRPFGKVTYLHRDPKYSGMVLYYLPSGQFVLGFQYKDGKVVARIEPYSNPLIEGAPTKATTKSGCYTEYFYYFETFWIEYTSGFATITRVTHTVLVELATTKCPVGEGGGGGEYERPPSGGGGGGTPTDTKPPKDSIAPLAAEVFVLDSLSKEQKTLFEKTLKLLLANCMGKGLYDALVKTLNSKRFSFEYDPTMAGGVFEYGGNKSANLKLGSLNSSNLLLHEMVHTLRAYSETEASYAANKLNMEIESHYIQYVFLISLGMSPEKNVFDDVRYGSGIKDLYDKKLIDRFGNISTDNRDAAQKAMINIGQQFKSDPLYSKDNFNSYMPLDSYFKTMNTITKDC